MSLTATICTTLIVALAVYDAVAVYFGGQEASISAWMKNTALKHPFLTFAAGFLTGHFFGYMKPKDRK